MRLIHQDAGRGRLFTSAIKKRKVGCLPLVLNMQILICQAWDRPTLATPIEAYLRVAEADLFEES